MSSISVVLFPRLVGSHMLRKSVGFLSRKLGIERVRELTLALRTRLSLSKRPSDISK